MLRPAAEIDQQPVKAVSAAASLRLSCSATRRIARSGVSGAFATWAQKPDSPAIFWRQVMQGPIPPAEKAERPGGRRPQRLAASKWPGSPEPEGPVMMAGQSTPWRPGRGQRGLAAPAPSGCPCEIGHQRCRALRFQRRALCRPGGGEIRVCQRSGGEPGADIRPRRGQPDAGDAHHPAVAVARSSRGLPEEGVDRHEWPRAGRPRDGPGRALGGLQQAGGPGRRDLR